MSDTDNDRIIEEKIRKISANPPRYKMTEAKKRGFYASLYGQGMARFRLPEFSFIFNLSPAYATGFSLAMAALIFFGALPVYPVVTGVEGQAKIFLASRNEWVPFEGKDIRLGKGDLLKVFNGGRADLIIPGKYQIRLKDDTEIKLAFLPPRMFSGKTGYIMDRGNAYAYYNKQAKGALSINTPDSEVSVIGTNFAVSAVPMAHRTWVGVLDGAVKVTGAGRPDAANTVYVNAGEKTTVKKGAAPAKPSRLLENELMSMEELYRIGSRPQVSLIISTGKNRTRELLSLTALYISTDNEGQVPKEIERIVLGIRDAFMAGSKAGHLESIKELERLVDTYPNKLYDVQIRLFIGAYYEYVGEHDKAIDAFRKVTSSYADSKLASVAQYAIGIIYDEKLKDSRQAKAAYEQVLARYPASPEAQVAKEALGRPQGS